jgi:hypothetical protein
MSKVKTCYNLELLLKCREQSDALDLWTPENKLTRDTKIQFICSCGNLNKTVFRHIYKTGMKCFDCKMRISQEILRKKNLEEYGVESTNQLESVKQKIRETNLERRGVEHAFQSESVKQKIRETNLERRGVENPFQSEEIKQKIRETNLERRGVEYPLQCDEVKQKIRETNMEKRGFEYPLQCDEVKQKNRETNMEKRGVENPFQSEEIKRKIKETNREKYGVENPFQSEEIKQKTREKNVEKYGYEYPHQTQEVKEKIQKSYKKYWMDNFGVENSSQVPEIFEKIQKNSRKLKSYILPSGKEVKIQGYEHYALDSLVQIYKEDEIVVGAGNVPRIFYSFQNQMKRYFMDIYIPKNNLVIEVKSDYTMDKELEKNLAKRKACIEEGYDFQFWIYNKKLNLQIVNKEEEYLTQSK